MEYQDRVGAGGDHLKLPAQMCAIDAGPEKFVTVKKSIFGKILKDDGCFGSIAPEKRISAAENTYDLGEYLLNLRNTEAWQSEPGPVETRAVYYPPCHLREQNIGFPYLELMKSIPMLKLENIDGSFNCCGIAGIMGFKKEFHKASIKMGSRLIGKIRRIDPKTIITDCLSCRLQFEQTTPYPVRHPIEVIRDSYLGA
jgi:glycerol-3-phosphate dehydrogenase subunit C